MYTVGPQSYKLAFVCVHMHHGLLVRQLDSPTLYHWEQMKTLKAYVAWITLYSIYISMFPLIIWKKMN